MAEILDKVRQDLAARVPHAEIERRLNRYHGFVDGAQYAGAYGINGAPSLAPLKECVHEGGEYTDNCMACAPRWGFTGIKVVCS